MSITLETVLTAKENRRERQQAMLNKYQLPIVSITLNIPGTVKDLPVLRRLCDYAATKLQAKHSPLAVERLNLATGPEALLAIDIDADTLKRDCVLLEEKHNFSRLLDLDVFAADGRQLSRAGTCAPRTCLLCGEPALSCMHERRHTLPELLRQVERLLASFRAEETRAVGHIAEQIGRLATEAMLYEVTCTPSPGLVDRVNSGAHSDMDFYSFMSGSAALSYALARCGEAGVRHEGSLAELLPVLRLIGLEGEQSMLHATGGINTQKGLLFTLGLTAAAAGFLLAQEQKPTANAVAESIAHMTAGIVRRELASLSADSDRRLTAGERLYRKHGIRGIRGETEDGLPSVIMHSLPALRRALADGLTLNDSLLQALFALIATVEDTTIINRHDKHILHEKAQTPIREFLAAGGFHDPRNALSAPELDCLFIENNISPGGSADLLAVTWFLHKLETEFSVN